MKVKLAGPTITVYGVAQTLSYDFLPKQGSAPIMGFRLILTKVAQTTAASFTGTCNALIHPLYYDPYDGSTLREETSSVASTALTTSNSTEWVATYPSGTANASGPVTVKGLRLKITLPAQTNTTAVFPHAAMAEIVFEGINKG